MAPDPDDPDGDVPMNIDLREPDVAHTWAAEADAKRPWRAQLRAAIAEQLSTAARPIHRVLELGAGPGLLAERVLQTCALASYTLLDFSPPMLALARARVGANPAARFYLGDFKQPDWTARLDPPFDAVVTMQAIHEIRHKRHIAALYRQVHDVLAPGGLLLVCDHVPLNTTRRATALFATEDEQHIALRGAGFTDIATLHRIESLYLCRGRRPD